MFFNQVSDGMRTNHGDRNGTSEGNNFREYQRIKINQVCKGDNHVQNNICFKTYCENCLPSQVHLKIFFL